MNSSFLELLREEVVNTTPTWSRSRAAWTTSAAFLPVSKTAPLRRPYGSHRSVAQFVTVHYKTQAGRFQVSSTTPHPVPFAVKRHVGRSSVLPLQAASHPPAALRRLSKILSSADAALGEDEASSRWHHNRSPIRTVYYPTTARDSRGVLLASYTWSRTPSAGSLAQRSAQPGAENLASIHPSPEEFEVGTSKCGMTTSSRVGRSHSSIPAAKPPARAHHRTRRPHPLRRRGNSLCHAWIQAR